MKRIIITFGHFTVRIPGRITVRLESAPEDIKVKSAVVPNNKPLSLYEECAAIPGSMYNISLRVGKNTTGQHYSYAYVRKVIHGEAENNIITEFAWAVINELKELLKDPSFSVTLYSKQILEEQIRIRRALAS